MSAAFDTSSAAALRQAARGPDLDSPRRDSPPLGGARDHAPRSAHADLTTSQVRLRKRRPDEEERLSTRRITIFDTTLRDGEQSPGIALHPRREGRDRRAARAARRRRDRGRLCDLLPRRLRGHPYRRADRRSARPSRRSPATSQEDVDAAVEALADAPRSRLHVVIATSPIHMERKLSLEPDEVARAGAHRRRVRSAAGVDEVEFSAEDATRSDPEFLARVCRDDDRRPARPPINLPDTVGYCLPNEYAAFLRRVRRHCPELDRVTLSVHCHNDLGLATANTLAGVAAGAGQVECTVNGIGERAGNAALEEVVMALRVRRGRVRRRDAASTSARSARPRRSSRS